MRTITLELVRHGPAHNQLLSPLTQYLALCENHPAVTLQLPLEHNQMLYRLSALAYRMGPEPREFQMRDTAQLIGELLARIPGLTADMNRRDDRSGDVFAQNVDGDRDRRDDRSEDGSAQRVDGDRATHLRLVLSASELALLPFELAVAPNGFPGAGQPLLLQSVRPVALTRETRRLAEEQVVWPRHPRVLFVAASPPELPPPPAAAHLLALRRALEPWIGTRGRTAEGVASETGDDRLAQHLTPLADASLEAIENACSEGNYTHVHILAHGAEYKEGYDTRFGLLLHDRADPMGRADRVSGERLATALRTSRKGTSGQLARPTVVTLASCYSAGVGSVTLTGVGASIAHALHADGIPMVIASQFPLSFEGSVLMVEMLYEGLLSGEDPRRLLIDLRRSLHTQFPDTHDWASITAYSSLPLDFDRQLPDVQIQRAQRSIEVALDRADEVVARGERVRRSRQGTANQAGSTAAAAGETEIDSAMKRVRESRAPLDRLVGRLPSQRSIIVSLLAQVDQLEAALEYQTLKRKFGPIAPEELDKRVWPLLEQARKRYDEVFRLNATDYWAVVQYVSLSVVMRHGGRPMQGADPANGEIGGLWTLAEVRSRRDLLSFDYARRALALGSLIELYLLAPAIKEVKKAREHPGPPRDWAALATQKAKELAKMARPGADDIFFPRRQIDRYLALYGELCPSLEEAVGIAEQVARLLPAQLPQAVPPS